MGDVYTLICHRSGELSKAFKKPMPIQNICSDAFREHDCWSLAKTRVRTKICPAHKCCILNS